MTEQINLEPITCEIEYADANDDFSIRSITLQSIEPGPRAPILRAICHTRHAVRHFRTDRIEAVITADGEVMSWANFARGTLDLDLGALQPSTASHESEAAKAVRNRLRPPLTLLLLAAQRGGTVCDDAVARIAAWAREEAMRHEELVIPPIEALHTIISTMKPRETSVDGYAARIPDLDHEAGLRFDDAFHAVAGPDSARTALAQTILNSVTRERTNRESEMRRLMGSSFRTKAERAEDIASARRRITALVADRQEPKRGALVRLVHALFGRRK